MIGSDLGFTNEPRSDHSLLPTVLLGAKLKTRRETVRMGA